MAPRLKSIATKAPGLVESIYEWCMIKELGLRQLTAVNQKTIQITYKGFTKEKPFGLIYS